jgi:hypothetical protein
MAFIIVGAELPRWRSRTLTLREYHPLRRDGKRSILFGKHDREHAGRLFRIAWILGNELAQLVVVLDFPEELSADERETPEDIRTLQTLAREKVKGTMIARILKRSYGATRQKASTLAETLGER